MNNEYKKIIDGVNCIKEITDFNPEIGLVAGSGLGSIVEHMNIECIIPFKDITSFPTATNKNHNGRLVFGTLSNKNIVVMDGRIHYYEGYTMTEVVRPVRILKELGIKNLILTNASGGINSNFVPGDLMVITDHITSFVPSPLIGINIDKLGARFPDMTNVYNNELTSLLLSIGKEHNMNLKQGIYIQVTGPNYETPAEIKAYHTLGADAVGMSTACEAMAAIHCELKVCGISCITNAAAGITGAPLNDDEVVITANKSKDKFEKLIIEFINLLD